MDKRGVIVIGMLTSIVSLYFGVGGYDEDLEDIGMHASRYTIVLFGTCGISISNALINVPTMPEMIL